MALDMFIVLRVCVCGVVWTESGLDGTRYVYSITRMRIVVDRKWMVEKVSEFFRLRMMCIDGWLQ